MVLFGLLINVGRELRKVAAERAELRGYAVSIQSLL